MVEKVIDPLDCVEPNDSLSVTIDHTQIQKGWEDYVNKRKIPDEPSEEYLRGYVSAQMTGARTPLSTTAMQWMAAREEDSKIISELRKHVRGQSSEINNLKIYRVRLIAMNILFIVAAFVIGILIERPM